MGIFFEIEKKDNGYVISGVGEDNECIDEVYTDFDIVVFRLREKFGELGQVTEIVEEYEYDGTAVG